jgi:hypothetical protein
VKFARIGAVGHERPFVLIGQSYYDISSVTADIAHRSTECRRLHRYELRGSCSRERIAPSHHPDHVP